MTPKNPAPPPLKGEHLMTALAALNTVIQQAKRDFKRDPNPADGYWQNMIKQNEEAHAALMDYVVRMKK
jgi:hypothetical protein